MVSELLGNRKSGTGEDLLADDRARRKRWRSVGGDQGKARHLAGLVVFTDAESDLEF